MGEPPSTTSAFVFLSTMTGPAISTRWCWRLRRRQPATAFLLQLGIPGLEPMPHAASTVVRSSRRGDGRRAADDPFFAATGHLFAGTGIYFCCHRPCDLLEPKAPSPPTSVFAGTSMTGARDASGNFSPNRFPHSRRHGLPSLILAKSRRRRMRSLSTDSPLATGTAAKLASPHT
ncbi:uncharacterized protein LOC119368864 [Triticum dicoccoides]|uniref:uncharacterized protein LOC119368864 n=1 Tax=Triticum dicoccoides TaxID=85692 RepID=UPI00188FFAC0|nr:uncharacterized protein LOC119368864 [Triticum dicoccoides]